MTATFTTSRWAGTAHRSVDDVIAVVHAAAADGFEGVWLAQTTSVDALTALAVAAQVVPTIAVGTAVVPIQGRHPIPLAQQALTVAQAAGPGRFTLGIGVTHAMVSEGFYGIDYHDVVGLATEELVALGPLLGPDRRSDHAGRHLTARATLGLEGPPPGLLLAAMGPRMLALAGAHTDGTVTWMTGPHALRTAVVPALRQAATDAARPAPRVVVGLPVCVTDDAAGARDRIRPRIEGASAFPSYRRMLTAEGLDDLAGLALVGSAAEVTDRIGALRELGATELMADVFGTPAEQEATTALLRTVIAAS